MIDCFARKFRFFSAGFAITTISRGSLAQRSEAIGFKITTQKRPQVLGDYGDWPQITRRLFEKYNFQFLREGTAARRSLVLYECLRFDFVVTIYDVSRVYAFVPGDLSAPETDTRFREVNFDD